MATSVSSSSSGAGIDVAAVVSQLMTIEQRPLTLLGNREAAVTTRMSAVSRVQGAVSSLQTVAARLASAASWSQQQASVIGTGITAAVTDATQAGAGNYSVKVTRLAGAQSLASPSYAGSSTALGTGSLRLVFGPLDPATPVPSGWTAPAAVDIAISTSNNTLGGIRDAINAAQDKVTAALVTDATGTRLTLTARDTGVLAGFQVQVTSDDSNDARATALSRLGYVAGDPSSMTATQAAANAALTVNGLAVESATNTVTGVVAGVSLGLVQADPNATSTLSVALNTNASRQLLADFVKAYNDFNSTVTTLTAYDATNKKAAALTGDGPTRAVQSQLRAVLSGVFGSASARTLSDLGIQLQKDGSLKIDDSKAAAAVATPATVSSFFTATGSGAAGFGVRLQQVTDSLIGTTGMLPARIRSLQSQVDSLTKQQDALAQRLTLIQTRLTRQYTALDVLMQSSQNGSNSLASMLNSLPALPNSVSSNSK